LTELQSSRVVVQEIERRSNLKLALEDYENTFRPLAADGKITAAERSQLRNLAAKEGLDLTDVKSIESKYKFSETPGGATPHPSKAVTHTAQASPQP
jgi:hypothetical protein